MNIESLKQIKNDKIKENEIKEQEKLEKIKNQETTVNNLVNKIGVLNSSSTIKEIESKLYSGIKNISDEDLQELIEKYVKKDYESNSFKILFNLRIPKIKYKNEATFRKGSGFNAYHSNLKLSIGLDECDFVTFYSEISAIRIEINSKIENFNYEISGFSEHNEFWESCVIYDKLNTIICEKLFDELPEDLTMDWKNFEQIDEKSAPLIPNVENVLNKINDLLITRLEEFGCKIIGNEIGTEKEYDTSYYYELLIVIKNPLNEE